MSEYICVYICKYIYAFKQTDHLSIFFKHQWYKKNKFWFKQWIQHLSFTTRNSVFWKGNENYEVYRKYEGNVSKLLWNFNCSFRSREVGLAKLSVQMKSTYKQHFSQEKNLRQEQITAGGHKDKNPWGSRDFSGIQWMLILHGWGHPISPEAKVKIFPLQSPITKPN